MGSQDDIRILRPERPLDPRVKERLADELSHCPDLAFAHLPAVMVPARQEVPGLVLFVWLHAPALRSLRFALNLVSEAVARALPDGEYLDVVVLNSAPELLDQVERARSLLVENDPDEKARALGAAATGEDYVQAD